MKLAFWKRGKTLFFSCGDSKIDSNYRAILRELKINFVEVGKVNSGILEFNDGHEREARKIARKNFNLFRMKNIKKIIVVNPQDLFMLMTYKEFIPEWDIEVESVVKTIYATINPKKVRFSERAVVTYHDPCYLGRYCEIYEEPREILKMIGYSLVEMWHSRSDALCCGENLRGDISKSIGKLRVEEAKSTNSEKIISACNNCVRHLSENSDLKVEDISESLVKAMGINKRGENG